LQPFAASELRYAVLKIVEVGPRDGLQNEKQAVSVETRIELIRQLVRAGLKNIEAVSFVSPKWVPKMAGAADVMAGVPHGNGVQYSALTPNLQGLEAAIGAGLTEVAVFGAASEAFSQRNINCSIRESLERFRNVMQVALANGVKVRGYVSCVLGCPYEGYVSPDKVAEVAALMRDMGCYEISLGDTIGKGTPQSKEQLLEVCLRAIPAENLAGHFHDTYGLAIANISKSLEMGIRVFDRSIAGLGGCPYAKGASGNVATEDVAYLMKAMGFETGINLGQLVQAGQFINHELNRIFSSRVGQALLREAPIAHT
jgi:hydroxymethylglutaryl-CoA lyase